MAIVVVKVFDVGSDKWHCRLGHMIEKNIFKEQHKVNFKTDEELFKLQRPELVHTRVWGPSQVPSFNGAMYFATFVDAICKVYSK